MKSGPQGKNLTQKSREDWPHSSFRCACLEKITSYPWVRSNYFHQPNSTPEAEKLRRELLQFTGSLERYRHGINPQVIYTPGVHCLAEEAGAYWLIDAIASHIGGPVFNKASQADNRIQNFHSWCLEVTGSKAVLRAMRESEEPPFAPKAFITQEILFMDFPLDEFNLWAGYDGTYWTLYLPSEH